MWYQSIWLLYEGWTTSLQQMLHNAWIWLLSDWRDALLPSIFGSNWTSSWNLIPAWKLKVQHHCQNLLIPASDLWAALVAKHQWRTSAKRPLCKTPVIGDLSGKNSCLSWFFIFEHFCFLIYCHKCTEVGRHSTCFHWMDVETVALW